MKVGEIFSSPTIGSSRALSFYSVIVIAVIWTETPTDKLPGFGSLNATPVQLFEMMLALLGFMSLMHAVNWVNDLMSVQSKSSMNEYQKHAEIGTRQEALRSLDFDPDEYIESMQDNEPAILSDSVASPTHKIALAASRDRTVVRVTNYLLRYLVHFLVPLGLAAIAAASLTYAILNVAA